jgi:epoxyqueuosine reductase
MNNDAQKQQLLDLAHQLGFSLVGIADARYTQQARQSYLDWCEAGYCADMLYLKDRRDIVQGLEAVLPGVRCAIMLGMPYKHPRKSDHNKPHGLVSLYASGRDYHRSFESRQKKLLQLLVDWGDKPKAYVDYGPALERYLAVQAGLGFIGKNGCLIHQKYGSFVFFGVILSTLRLPFDAPLPGDCGDCTRCLAACPTQAICRPCTVDARSCISYQTIENKGKIPVDLRPRMGRWILGCDLCQLVCPFNRGAPDSNTEDFQGQRLSERTNLYSFLEMSEPEFTARFAGNAAMRPGRNGMARNAAISLGNGGDPAQVPRMRFLLESEQNPIVREALVWAIDRLLGN